MNVIIFTSQCVYIEGFYRINYGYMNTLPFMGILKERVCTVSLLSRTHGKDYFIYKLLIEKKVYDRFILRKEAYRVDYVEVDNKLLYFFYMREDDKDYARIIDMYEESSKYAVLLFENKLI